MLKQAVLVSIGRNPVSGVNRASPTDCVAMTLGLGLGGTQDVIHAGDPAEPALHEYLAYGAPAVQVLSAPDGADPLPALTSVLSGYDLILCGDRAEAGSGSGLLPYLLAKALNLPVVSAALEVKPVGDAVEVLQFLPKGRRRPVRVPLPAVIAVHRLADYRPSYVYARRRQGRILSQEGVAGPAAPSPWATSPAGKRLVKLAPAETRQGHARMLAAITLESAAGAVIKTGNATEKAEAIMTYLRDKRLIGS